MLSKSLDAYYSTQASGAAVALLSQEAHVRAVVQAATALLAAAVEPALEVLALAHVEEFELVTAFDDGLDADAGDAHAATHC